jgi:hypothetical protein
LIIGGDAGDVQRVVDLHGCDPADTVRVRETMPDGKYKIEPLREIIAKGNQRPQFGETRVFVFTDFDSLGENHLGERCQNTLLKFIEEPQEHNRFVMTAKSKSGILSTILSRVVTVSAGHDAADVPDASETAVGEIASAIMTAIKNRDKNRAEYDTAAAFARIKDRQVLSGVLERLLTEFAAIMPAARKPEKVIAATDVLQKYLKRIEINPNVAITVTSCAAEIHTALHT